MEPDVNEWRPIRGETPIDPSGLKDRSIMTRGDLNRAEALNIRKAHVKYLAAPPAKRVAPFSDTWPPRRRRGLRPSATLGFAGCIKRCTAMFGNGRVKYGKRT
jgi:hypothetical protein